MKNIFISLIFIFISACASDLASDSADEEVPITSEKQLKDLSKEWDCEWKEPSYSGTKHFSIEEMSLKKITGTVTHSACPEATGTIKSKVKIGKFVGTQTLSAPCAAKLSGTYTVYKTADGSFYLKGSYNNGSVKGESKCVPTVN